MPLTEVQNLVNTRLAQKISQVIGRRPGVAVAAASARPCASRPTPRRWPSYGIGLDTLRTAITAANANAAKGSFDGPKRAYSINANDQLLTADDYDEPDRRLQERRAGAPGRRRQRRRQRREHPARRLGGHALRAAPRTPRTRRMRRRRRRHAEPGDHPQRAAPAGRQRDRHGRRDQGAAARRCRPGCRQR